MNNILIDIRSTIKQTGEETQNIDMTTEGEWYEKLGAIFIVYEESDLSGMAGNKTMLKIKDQTITLTRFGDNHSKMVFDVNENYETMYHTAYGAFEMHIETYHLSYELNDLSGEIHFKYDMSLEAVSSSQNELVIKVRPL